MDRLLELQSDLKRFKKANKTYKEKILKQKGYNYAETYIAYLIVQIDNLQKGGTVISTPAVPVVNVPTIHNVHVLDVSDSMNMYGKILTAVNGINVEAEALKESKEVNYLQTVILFSDYYFIKVIHDKVPIKDFPRLEAKTEMYTALLDAIGFTIDKFTKEAKPGEKVLLKISTDGDENNSKKYNWSDISKLIKQAEGRGFTVTFIGTEKDVKTVVKNLNIDDSNTMVHDNTGEGISRSFAAAAKATQVYASKVVKGEDVLTGFYKKKGEL